MILTRQPVKYRAWWETRLCENFGCKGWATILWAAHLAPVKHSLPDNDRDHLKW